MLNLRIYYIRMPDPTWAEGLHAQHASVWAGQVIKGNVFIGSSHTWWNYPYSCINVPFSDRQLGKIAPKQTHPFSIWPFRILSVCVFSNICEFLVDWTCSKWALESASRQDWDADGGRGRGPLVQWQIFEIFKIFNTNIDLGTVADIWDIQY